MKTLWLIPARGGSKGIPHKNLKPFCGLSLVRRAVAQALEVARHDDVVFVSTDSEAIKEESEKSGIKVPFLRPSELANDNSSTYSVILHVLEEFKRQGKEFDKVVLLQPTSPLRTTADIESALSLWDDSLDMVVSVCKSEANPYYNLFETDAQGYLRISKGDGKYIRRQDAPPVWQYNGAVYVMSVKALWLSPMNEFKRIIPYEMPAFRSLDLDTPEDWLIAETVYKSISGNQI